MEREENPQDSLVKKTISTLPRMERGKNPRDCLVKKTKHITLTGAREESTGLCGEEQ